MATLKIGMDILFDREHVVLSVLYNHAACLRRRAPDGQRRWPALNVPVVVMETAGEAWVSGAWRCWPCTGRNGNRDETPESYLGAEACSGTRQGDCVEPKPEDEVARARAKYRALPHGLAVEQAAVESLR